jgi:ABC-type sugar transport system permease subunit
MNVRFGYGATIAYALFMLIVVFSIVSYKLSMGKGDQE